PGGRRPEGRPGVRPAARRLGAAARPRPEPGPRPLAADVRAKTETSPLARLSWARGLVRWTCAVLLDPQDQRALHQHLVRLQPFEALRDDLVGRAGVRVHGRDAGGHQDLV